MTTIVSSFGPAGAALYGCRFVEEFAAYWPADIQLVLYVEAPFDHPRAEVRDLLALPDCAAFLERHKDNLAAQGKVPTPCWGPKALSRGESYRTDAYKFCRKVFAVADAAARCADDLMFWLDADVRTLARVPDGWLESLMAGRDLAYIGRAQQSECGFIGFRLPQTMPLIDAWAAHYATDSVFQLREFHDSYVFDRVRETTPGLRAVNLSPKGSSGHPWMQSPLAQFTDHCKGRRRKALGYSPERFLTTKANYAGH